MLMLSANETHASIGIAVVVMVWVAAGLAVSQITTVNVNILILLCLFYINPFGGLVHTMFPNTSPMVNGPSMPISPMDQYRRMYANPVPDYFNHLTPQTGTMTRGQPGQRIPYVGGPAPPTDYQHAMQGIQHTANMFPHTDWQKFEAQARPSQLVEDARGGGWRPEVNSPSGTYIPYDPRQDTSR